MLIVEGVYHWRPRRVAFRNDYCVRCGAERVAIQVRTIDVWHVYWIPLVPLGVLAALAAIMWFAPTRANEPDMIVIWAMRLLFSALLVAALFWVTRGSDDVGRRRRLAQIQPSQATECPLCGISLQLTEPARCVKCGIVRA